MMTEQQQKWFRRHALERLQLSVNQAEDWVNFYALHGPVESLKMWETTFEYRKELLEIGIEHDNIIDGKSVRPDSATTT